MAKALSIELIYELTGQRVDSAETAPTFIRGDSILLKGKVFGASLTGLAAKLTAKMILPDGTLGPTVISKSSGATTPTITITSVNTSVSTVDIVLTSADTAAFEPGQRFVFDVEFTTTTPVLTRSVKGSFSIEEDYTVV